MKKLIGTDFRPAKPWGWLIGLAALINRYRLRRHTTLDVRAADLATLRDLPPGCIIAPNHAHATIDPRVTFKLAQRAGRRFIFMATREAFDVWRGWQGRFMQRLGAFSINRGGDNTDARRFAGEVLVEGAYDLLMFPEGNVYLLNDLIMPLKPGVAHFAHETYDKLEKQGMSRPVYIVPVAIKYKFTEDISAALEASIVCIEEKVFDRPQRGEPYSRILAIGTELLARSERRYGVTPVQGEPLFERIRRLRRWLLEDLERKHFGGVREGFDFDRARKIIIRISGFLMEASPGAEFKGPPFVPKDDPLKEDWDAATLCARSVAFHDDYLLENQTPERMAETINKLWREVLFVEDAPTVGKRRAIIRIAPPLDVGEFMRGQSEEASRDDLIEALVIRLHGALQGELDAIAREEAK